MCQWQMYQNFSIWCNYFHNISFPKEKKKKESTTDWETDQTKVEGSMTDRKFGSFSKFASFYLDEHFTTKLKTTPKYRKNLSSATE